MNALVFGVDNATGGSVCQSILNADCFEACVGVDYDAVAQGLYRDGVSPAVVDRDVFVAETAEIARERDIDVVFVGKHDAVTAFATHRDRFEESGMRVAVPDERVSARLRDKRWGAATFPDLVPSEVRSVGDDPPSPVLVRRRHASIEGTPEPIDQRRELKQERRSMVEDGCEPYVQRYVPGPVDREYLVGQVYGPDGTLLGEGSARLLSKGFSFWGKVQVAETTVDDALRARARAVGEALDVSGSPLRLLFKRTPAGEFSLLGVDTRFWEPTYLTAQAGFNAPELLGRALVDGTRPESDRFESGVRSTRNTVYNGVARTEIDRLRGTK